MNNHKHYTLRSILYIAGLLFATIFVCTGCQQSAQAGSLHLSTPPVPKREVSSQFKQYWYAGTAEISSYTLEQARYGELRDGTAALIFVTEDFLPEAQVKADQQSDHNIPVLKLNSTKNFNTGIYPYAVITSTFLPVYEERHALKVSNSIQEWCGHVYAQLNNRSQFEVQSHSYFQSEGDQAFTLPKAVLENELWNLLRIDPKKLPTGSFQAIPALDYVRMKHVPFKAYNAQGTLTATSYTLTYPELERSLTIRFEEAFPYTIQGWEETFVSGYGSNAQTMTTKATRINTIQSPYWNKNSNKDAYLRAELGLE